MAERKLTLLVPDISAPTIGASLRIARLLKQDYDIEITGPDFGAGTCSMYRNAFDWNPVSCPRMYRFPDFFRERRKLANHIDGDMIIAMKAYANTVPVALELKRKRGCGVIVYLDEWDGALWRDMTPRERVKQFLHHWHHPLNELYAPWVERMLPLCDQVISTTTFLREKFGGHIAPAGVDTDFFCPQPREKVARLRREWGLNDAICIGFGGVARPHKGIEPFLDAVVSMPDLPLKFVVVGPRTPYMERLLAVPEYGGRLVCIGAAEDEKKDINQRVHEDMPGYLAMMDILVVSLGDTVLAQSQMPIKVYEAMAMEKPVIATAVSDLPLVLGDCGWIIGSRDVSGIRDVVRKILLHADEANRRARAAREKCVTQFDEKIVRKRWVGLLEDVYCTCCRVR